MSKKISKKITMNELAVMVAKGFSSVNKRIAEVERRFDDVEEVLNQLENLIFNMEEPARKRGVSKR